MLPLLPLLATTRELPANPSSPKKPRSRRRYSRSVATIEDVTGLTRDHIRAGFRADPPQTVADQASAQGVDPDALIDAIVADTRRRVERAVADGDLSRELADARLTGLQANVTGLVTTIPTGLGGHPAGSCR